MTQQVATNSVVMWTSDTSSGWQSSVRNEGWDWKVQTTFDIYPPEVEISSEVSEKVKHFNQDCFKNVVTGTVVTRTTTYVEWRAKEGLRDSIDVCGYCGMVHDSEHPRNGYDCWNCGGN